MPPSAAQCVAVVDTAPPPDVGAPDLPEARQLLSAAAQPIVAAAQWLRHARGPRTCTSGIPATATLPGAGGALSRLLIHLPDDLSVASARFGLNEVMFLISVSMSRLTPFGPTTP